MLVLVSYQPIHPLSEFLLATVLTLVTDSSIFFGYWFPEKKIGTSAGSIVALMATLVYLGCAYEGYSMIALDP